MCRSLRYGLFLLAVDLVATVELLLPVAVAQEDNEAILTVRITEEAQEVRRHLYLQNSPLVVARALRLLQEMLLQVVVRLEAASTCR